jgi:hypothetical protein
MKRVVGICTLIAVGFTVRLYSRSNLGLDVHIHDTYHVIPFRVVAFWCLLGIASAWLLFFAISSLRRPS